MSSFTSCVNRNFVQLWPCGQTDGWWQLLLGQETWRSCSQAKRVHMCECVTCALWVSGMVEVCECFHDWRVGAQSRASSGWVFSLSPRSSCFSVPASTTDWDLKARTGTCQWGLLQNTYWDPFASFRDFCSCSFSPLSPFINLFWSI